MNPEGQPGFDPTAPLVDIADVVTPPEGEKPNLWMASGLVPPAFGSESKPTGKPARRDTLDVYRAMAERERMPKSCSVSIDRAALDKVVGSIHAKIPKDYREDRDVRGQKSDLEVMMDRFKRLPDGLNFQPGMTLIVGDNGSGKSTLARAIFYAMNIERHVQDGAPREEAIQDTLDPRSSPRTAKNRGYLSDLRRSAVAAEIAPALRLQQTGITDSIRYTDCTTITGEAYTVDSYDMDSLDRRDAFYESWAMARSNRQTIDQSLRDDGTNPIKMVDYVDEPEIGMSPRRQKGLQKEIEARVKEGSIQIVPTNSVVLYDNPNIPRIDLDFPERGIFYPRDYPNEE